MFVTICNFYHRLTRATTPGSVSFRRFCPFRLAGCQPRSKGTSLSSIGENMPTQPSGVSKTKNHSKIHRWQVRSSFVGAEIRPDKKRPAENTCRIVKGLDAVWAHFCPSKPCLPLSIDGNVKGNRQGSLSRLITRRSDQNRKIKYCLLFCDFAGSLVKSPKGYLPSCPESMALRVLFVSPRPVYPRTPAASEVPA